MGLLFDCLEELNIEGVVKYISERQNEDGSFAGDKVV